MTQPDLGRLSSIQRTARLFEVVDALQRRRGLQIRYRGFDGSRRSVRIEPLSLALYDHQLYVIGRPRGGPPALRRRIARLAQQMARAHRER
jgi:hypothetical protein